MGSDMGSEVTGEAAFRPPIEGSGLRRASRASPAAGGLEAGVAGAECSGSVPAAHSASEDK